MQPAMSACRQWDSHDWPDTKAMTREEMMHGQQHVQRPENRGVET